MVRARHVVFATNAYTGSLVPELEGEINPWRDQVVVTEPVPPLWDFINWFSSPPAGSSYTYHMQRADGRIVIGANSASGDHFDDSVADPAVTERILNELRETYPALAEVQAEQVWTGVTSWTADGFPWVGELPSMPGCFVAAGFTEGMVQAFSSGRVVAHLLTGAEPPQPFNPRCK